MGSVFLYSYTPPKNLQHQNVKIWGSFLVSLEATVSMNISCLRVSLFCPIICILIILFTVFCWPLQWWWEMLRINIPRSLLLHQVRWPHALNNRVPFLFYIYVRLHYKKKIQSMCCCCLKWNTFFFYIIKNKKKQWTIQNRYWRDVQSERKLSRWVAAEKTGEIQSYRFPGDILSSLGSTCRFLWTFQGQRELFFSFSIAFG
jgi:hypothetical protein